MPKGLTPTEQLRQEREARGRLIQRASAGDKEALRILAAAPHRMRVYTPEEREAYIKKQKQGV